MSTRRTGLPFQAQVEARNTKDIYFCNCTDIEL